MTSSTAADAATVAAAVAAAVAASNTANIAVLRMQLHGIGRRLAWHPSLVTGPADWETVASLLASGASFAGLCVSLLAHFRGAADRSR